MKKEEVKYLMLQLRNSVLENTERYKQIILLQEECSKHEGFKKSIIEKIVDYILEDKGYVRGQRYDRNGTMCTFVDVTASNMMYWYKLILNFAPDTKAGKPGKRIDTKYSLEIDLSAYPEIYDVLKELEEKDKEFREWRFYRMYPEYKKS
jgi:hypothetical protein